MPITINVITESVILRFHFGGNSKYCDVRLQKRTLHYTNFYFFISLIYLKILVWFIFIILILFFWKLLNLLLCLFYRVLFNSLVDSILIYFILLCFYSHLFFTILLFSFTKHPSHTYSLSHIYHFFFLLIQHSAHTEQSRFPAENI